MIDRNSLAYRKSTAAVVVSNENKIILVQKMGWQDNEWDFPGGGVEENETDEQAMIRELNEELGTNKLKIIAKSSITDQYEWPDEVIERKLKEKGHTWRGQQRTQFLAKLTGTDADINFPKDELENIMWINPTELQKYFIFPNQFEKAEKLLKEFKLI